MRGGRLIAVVGPSGVGKDSVMTGLKAAWPRLHLVRRVITRPAGLGGEDYDAVTEAEFEAMARDGAFVVHWRAHGRRYGIPLNVRYFLNQGHDCLANFSRGALSEAAGHFQRFLVLNVTAKPETLARRLTERGRESAEEVQARLAVAQSPLPDHLETVHVANDGPLSETIARATALIQPVSA